MSGTYKPTERSLNVQTLKNLSKIISNVSSHYNLKYDINIHKFVFKQLVE